MAGNALYDSDSSDEDTAAQPAVPTIDYGSAAATANKAEEQNNVDLCSRSQQILSEPPMGNTVQVDRSSISAAVDVPCVAQLYNTWSSRSVGNMTRLGDPPKEPSNRAVAVSSFVPKASCGSHTMLMMKPATSQRAAARFGRTPQQGASASATNSSARSCSQPLRAAFPQKQPRQSVHNQRSRPTSAGPTRLNTRRPESRSFARATITSAQKNNHVKQSKSPGNGKRLTQALLLAMRIHVLSDWAHLPDIILLQVVVLLGPGDMCATAPVCRLWAETAAASETWLWSIVGSARLPQNAFRLMESWAQRAQVGIRLALQLWVCRAHLWGVQTWNPHVVESPFRIISEPLNDKTTPMCCTAWASQRSNPASGADQGAGVAVGLADGLLAFYCLETEEAPEHGARGVIPMRIEKVASVPSAHGRQLITSIQPLSSKVPSVVSSGLDGLLRIWDRTTGEETAQIITEHGRGINQVAVSPCKSDRLLCCGDDGLVLVYDGTTVSGSPMMRMTGHKAPAYCATWLSPNACSTGGFDRKAFVWDCRSQSRAVASMTTRHHIYSLAVIDCNGDGCHNQSQGERDPQQLVAALADGSIAQWDLRYVSKEPLQELVGHSAAVEALAVLPGGVLASASADCSMRLWDMAHSVTRATCTWDGLGALTGLASLMEDTLIVTGLQTSLTVLTLDYKNALACVPDVLARLQSPMLQPWKPDTAPPEGYGRHYSKLQQKRQQRGSSRKLAADAEWEAPTPMPVSRNPFDRSSKRKPIPLGATGASHRTFLSGARP